jgi:hypothetical protein
VFTGVVREAERSYGIPDNELTPPASWSACCLTSEKTTKTR